MRDCPTCYQSMEYLGMALDDDGQMFDQFRCECGYECESKVRPQFGWRTEITSRVAAYRKGCGMKRTESKTRYRNTGPTPAVAEAVVRRDEGRCVRCGEPVEGDRGWLWSLHHRRGRDGKPDSHLTQNLITVCGGSNFNGCHGFIHTNRTEAQTNGWWISRIALANDPLRIPILVDRGSRWVYLGADGRMYDEPPEERCA